MDTQIEHVEFPIEDIDAKIARLQLAHREKDEKLEAGGLSDDEEKELKWEKLALKRELQELGAETLPKRKRCQRRAA